MGSGRTVRRSKSSPESIGSKLVSELCQMVEQGYTGSFRLEGSMVSGGIGSADFKKEPQKKNLLKNS